MKITITLAEAVEYDKLKKEVEPLRANEVGYKQRITVLEEQVKSLEKAFDEAGFIGTAAKGFYSTR